MTTIELDPRPVFKRPAVLVVCLILLVAAFALNFAVQSLGLYFKKQRVELRKPLTSLAEEFGNWVQVTQDQPLGAAIEHALGTKDYITRTYIDTLGDPDLKEKAHRARTSRDERERARLFNEIIRVPGVRSVGIHMAYYTGKADTVAHVPERCMVGGGYDPTNTKLATFELPYDKGRRSQLTIKYFDFEKRGGDLLSVYEQEEVINVGYFFVVNGQFEHDSSTGVRPVLQDIFERYAYYCKVELYGHRGRDEEQARRDMGDFLRAAMPSIEECLPDWDAVKAAAAAN